MLDIDADSARGLVLAAIVLQLVFLSIGVLVILFFFAAAVNSSYYGPGGTPAMVFPIFGLALPIVISFGSFWIVLDYLLILKPIDQENLEKAESNALVLGLVQLFLGGVIPGILIIFGYMKVRDSLRYKRMQNQSGGWNN